MDEAAPRYVYAFDEPPSGSANELPRLLGGKGANLATMATELGLPVPPGFTITTRACREALAGSWPDALDDEIRTALDHLGERLGRRFGDAGDPLLVSVRSGAPVSMPGMMDTVLNVGLTEGSARGLAAASGDEAFAADCLRRLRDGYRDVIGLDEPPDDPWAQLRAAIDAVFRSWNSDRARAYRRREGIDDDIGTAVTVQAMVFGNRGAESGTGVVFTRNPATGDPGLYGDIMFDAQGEDVVAGTHEPQPLSALDEALPDVAADLRRHATLLERHYADLCDIEFTIERGTLWLLQVRVGKRSPRAALRIAADMADDEQFPLSRAEAVERVRDHLAEPPRIFVRADDTPPIATGLPASPGVATGAIVTSSEAAEAAQGDVILVRAETSPDDVRGMARSAGVLTALGGLASHAAVVARGWGIPAVVGAGTVRPFDDRVEIDGRALPAGEVITIDGGSGEVFAGRLAGEWKLAPEAERLLGWAAELGTEIEAAPGGEADDAPVESADAGGATTDDVLRALLIRGSVAPAELGTAVGAAEAELKPLVDALTAAGHVTTANEALRLTSEGKLEAAELFAVDRGVIGDGRAGERLEAFHELDQRMKEIVTAWQVREIGGEQVLNDHADPDYDGDILHRLAALHADTAEFLAPLADELRRFGIYRSRLGIALARAREGDQRHVASPRVDSYHSVWFELHEDLIRLAGRRRSDEAAAGRA